MKTIILVGGMGTRLQSVVKDVPKPMADINGKPFLEYLMQNMLNFGTTEFILCTGYKHEVIIDYFKDNFKGIPVKYSIEEELLGTGGAIKQAFDMFEIDNAIVLNGDTFVKMDYAKFYQKMFGEKLGLSLKYVNNASRYGLVKTLQDRVIEFTEKKDTDEEGFINAGIYTVYFKAVATNHTTFYGTFIVTVEKAFPIFTIPSPIIETLTYTGSPQEVIIPGETTIGTLWYKVNDGDYSTDIPTATDAGLYIVYYKVTGNENYKDFEPNLGYYLSIENATLADVSVAQKGTLT